MSWARWKTWGPTAAPRAAPCPTRASRGACHRAWRPHRTPATTATPASRTEGAGWVRGELEGLVYAGTWNSCMYWSNRRLITHWLYTRLHSTTDRRGCVSEHNRCFWFFTLIIRFIPQMYTLLYILSYPWFCNVYIKSQPIPRTHTHSIALLLTIADLV